MKKILITGGTGFIGSHLAEYCASKGYKVTVFDRYNPIFNLGNLSSSKYNKKIKFVFGDIRDFDSIDKEVRKNNVILHLAALIGIPYSYVSPLAYLKTNVEGTYNILESVRRNNTSKLILTSTSEVYGTAKYVPIDENHPLQAQSPYSASKMSADQLAISYNLSFGLPVTIIRPFNTFGPRQSLRAVIPTIINQAIDRKKILNLGIIKARRDFNYINDVVDAFEKSIRSKKDIGQIINIGSGYEISIEELAKTIYEIMDLPLKIHKDKKRLRPAKSEVLRLKASNIKAKKLLNWKPKFNNRKKLKEALKITIKWYQKKENREKFKDSSFIV